MDIGDCILEEKKRREGDQLNGITPMFVNRAKFMRVLTRLQLWFGSVDDGWLDVTLSTLPYTPRRKERGIVAHDWNKEGGG